MTAFVAYLSNKFLSKLKYAVHEENDGLTQQDCVDSKF